MAVILVVVVAAAVLIILTINAVWIAEVLETACQRRSEFFRWLDAKGFSGLAMTKNSDSRLGNIRKRCFIIYAPEWTPEALSFIIWQFRLDDLLHIYVIYLLLNKLMINYKIHINNVLIIFNNFTSKLQSWMIVTIVRHGTSTWLNCLFCESNLPI